MSTDKMIVYCTKGNVMFNSDGELEKVPKKKSMKIKKTIVNDIFETMREFNEDPYWNMFLLKASRDNFPKGFSYRNNTVFFTMNAKYNFEVQLNPDTPKESFFKLKEFMIEKGYFSNSDREKMKIKQNSHVKKQEELADSWKGLGKMQNNAVCKFINEKVKEHNLTDDEKSDLTSIIKIGISSGYLNNNNITVEDSVITNFQYIEWNEDKRKFKINTRNIKVKKQKHKNEYNDLSTDNTTTCLNFEKKYDISNISKKWEKFLAIVYKKRT